MITVFYDGKCGLCRREIDHYKKLDEKGRTTTAFEWVDVASDASAAGRLGVSQATALMPLHATDAQGPVQRGVAVFNLIWTQFARWSVMAKSVACHGIKQLAAVAYEAFARIRFKAYPHCKVASHKVDASS